MKEHIAHSGAWGLPLIVIVGVSWLLYRYLAPKTWKEWASAGVVQAFIIALYAEMYGFPLTIYLLVRFFGLGQWHAMTTTRSESYHDHSPDLELPESAVTTNKKETAS